MEISSDLADLTQIRAFVRRVCRSLAGPVLNEESTDQLELAVHEAASNIALHAYHGRIDRKIQIRAEVFADRVAIGMYHAGEGFTPEATKLPVFDGSQENGFGLYLIARCVDEVSYFHNSQERNCIQLVKNRRGI